MPKSTLSSLVEHMIGLKTERAFGAMLLDFIESETDRLGRQAVASLTADQWPGHKEDARRKLLASLGLAPLPMRTPLHPRAVGTVEEDDYRIERLVFEPQPGFEVPGLLYLPKGTALPVPAVLYCEGHWMQWGKMEPDIQACCIGLAKLGFVAFVFDPIGQGERGASFVDHAHLELLPLGLTQEGLMVWEHMRAIDYLLTRPEVDGQRIGITGASGGGLSTVFTAAADTRIGAAVPVCYVTSYSRYLRAMRGLNWNNQGDLCNQVPNVVADAEMGGLCGLIWPRPLLIINGWQDPQFPVQGAQEVLEQVSPLYEMVDPTRVALYAVDTGHGYGQNMREAAYGWLLKWLKGVGDGSPHPERSGNILPLDAPELRCFPHGRTMSSEKAIRRLVTDRARSLGCSSSNASIRSTDTQIIREVLGHKRSPSRIISGQIIDRTVTDAGVRVEQHLIASEQGITVPAYLIEPKSTVEEYIVCLDDLGAIHQGSLPLIQCLLDTGKGIFALDPRGVGATAPEPPHEMTLATVNGTLEVIATKEGEHLEFETVTDSLMLGRSLVGQQVEDVLAGIQYLASVRGESGSRLSLIGRGKESSLRALLVAALHGAIQTVVLEELVFSLSSLILDEQVSAPLIYYVFGILQHFDLADVAALLGSRTLIIANPVGSRGQRISTDAMLQAYGTAVESFRRCGGTFTVLEDDLSHVCRTWLSIEDSDG